MNGGFHFGNKTEYLDVYRQDSALLGLIAKGGGVEVMIQEVRKGESIFIEPGDVNDLMEFFYVVDGKLEYIGDDNQKVVLAVGDYFYVHHLISTVQLHSLTFVKLLYVSTEPVFHHLSKSITDLTKLAKQVEDKDSYTHSHIQRVKDYSIKIANKLNLSKEMCENIGYASLFHDLGKVNIPDNVLNKKTHLDDAEYDIVKRHPIDGAGFVINTYYKHIGKIIEQHHERMDGSGYPYGLQGEEILLEARVIAIADSFDAMTSTRPYRKGMDVESAFEELLRCRGTQFDNKCIDAFYQVLLDEGYKL